MKYRGIIFLAVCLAGIIAAAYGLGLFGNGKPVQEVGKINVQTPPVTSGTSGRVTMIDLGATECIPCKMMAPILKELEREYAGVADIVFIDVWKNPAEGRKYGIQAIPTQIFFDSDGNEVYRHVGFLDKKPIVEILTRLGAVLPAGGSSAAETNN